MGVEGLGDRKRSQRFDIEERRIKADSKAELENWVCVDKAKVREAEIDLRVEDNRGEVSRTALNGRVLTKNPKRQYVRITEDRLGWMKVNEGG